MKLNFVGDIAEVKNGIDIFSKELGFEVSPDGIEVYVERNLTNRIEVIKDGHTAAVRFPEKIHFFRALGLFVEALREKEEFIINEEPQFTLNGVMLDISQSNAVPRVETVKKLLTKMALMGLNMLMLYMEDSFVIKEYPYFGYMRGRYTYEELKECDDYADTFGIEIIPCVQTLAHMQEVLKWDCFEDIREDEATLLVGEPKTYEFLEVMLKTVTAPFRSKRVHIGMDEAWRLGLGKYLWRHGLKSKLDIMTEHVNKISRIIDKLGLKAMMWSDMYFRSDSPNGFGLVKDYPGMKIPEHVINSFPQNIQLVLWEYNQDSEEYYRKSIINHRKFGEDPIFQGGIINWLGFGVNYGKTFRTTNAALKVCKETGIKEVFASLWGDDGTENNIFSTLVGLQLYAEHGYAKELCEDKLKRRFRFCTGANYEDFMDIKYLDETPGTVKDNFYSCNPSKYLLWQNITMGLFDKNIEGLGLSGHYENLRLKMKDHISTNGEFGYIFELLEKVCAVLAIKAEIGLDILTAYRNNDMNTLNEIANGKLPELYNRAMDLRSYHREIWHRENKPYGWEVLDLRYGSLIMGIETAQVKLRYYLTGKIGSIEELEEEKLHFSGRQGLIPCYHYNRMPSASRLSQ